jgi:type IV pilus assembly protein PilE
MHMTQRTRQQGITLMELLTVMVIVGILSAIAIPSYTRYLLRTKRTDATVALTGFAQALERCFTRLNTYNLAGCGLAVPSVQNHDYTVTVDAANAATTPPSPGTTTFTLTATPTGGQAQDTKCGALSITDAGVQSVSGTGPAAECWAGR